MADAFMAQHQCSLRADRQGGWQIVVQRLGDPLKHRLCGVCGEHLLGKQVKLSIFGERFQACRGIENRREVHDRQ